MRKIVLFLCVFVILSVVVFADDDLSVDLRHYYSFDDADSSASSLYDLVETGQINGTINPGVTRSASGILGEAFEFDGSGGNVSFASEHLNEAANFAISCWLKADNTDLRAWYAATLSDATKGFDSGFRVSGTFHSYVFPRGEPDYDDTIVKSAGVLYHVVLNYDTTNKFTAWTNATEGATGGGGIVADTLTHIYFGGMATGGRNWDGIIDECGFWNRTLNSTEIAWLYNSGTGRTYDEIVPPIISNFTVTAIDAVSGTSITTFNATINGTHYSTISGTIVSSIPETNTESLFDVIVSSQCGGSFCNYSTNTYANKNASSNMQANLTFWFYQNTSYVSSVSEYAYQTMQLRVNHSNSSFQHYISLVAASLVYNGSIKTLNKYSFQNYTIFNVTFLTPTYANNVNVSFMWYYNITRNNSVGEVFSSTIPGVQQVNVIGIDNCSTYTTRAINFTIRNETNNAILNGTLAGNFHVWVSDEGNYRTFNLSWFQNVQFGICITPSDAEYVISSQMEYGASGFTTENYYFINTTIDSTTSLISLYLTDDSTAVTFTVTDENDNPVDGAYIYVNRYDLPTDSSTNTEIIKTNTEGQAIGQITLNTERYIFIVVYNGEIVFESSDVILTTTTYNIRVNLASDYFEQYDKVLAVGCELTYSNDTKTFSYTFLDTTGNVAQGCLYVDRHSGSTSQIVNSSCVSGSSGTLALTISTPTGIPTFFGRGTIQIDGIDYVCGNSTSYSYDTRHETFGLSGVFYSFLFIVFLVSVGIWSPTISVFFTILGLVVVNLLGLFFLNWAYLISIIIVGLIAMHKLSKR